MITPREIRDREFEKQLRGYSIDDVDNFLNEIIADLETLNREMAALREENEELRRKNLEHQKNQRSIINTLDSAKQLMKDISESAEKRADIIIRNAKMDAEMIVNDAKDYVARYGSDGVALKERVSTFRARYKQLLQDELEGLDAESDDLLSNLELDFFPEVFVDTLPEHSEDVPDFIERKAEAEAAAREAEAAAARETEEVARKADVEENIHIDFMLNEKPGKDMFGDTIVASRREISELLDRAKVVEPED